VKFKWHIPPPQQCIVRLSQQANEAIGSPLVNLARELDENDTRFKEQDYRVNEQAIWKCEAQVLGEKFG
jgi:hypothetical protein